MKREIIFRGKRVDNGEWVYGELIKLFNQNELPEPSNEDKDFSEDVFIVDQDNLNGIAYYSFKDSEWHFHTETMVDYFEEGNETKFWWYYPPVTIKNEVDNGK